MPAHYFFQKLQEGRWGILHLWMRIFSLSEIFCHWSKIKENSTLVKALMLSAYLDGVLRRRVGSLPCGCMSTLSTSLRPSILILIEMNAIEQQGIFLFKLFHTSQSQIGGKNLLVMGRTKNRWEIVVLL